MFYKLLGIPFLLTLFLQPIYAQKEIQVFIKDGQLVNAITEGPSWKEKEGAVQGRGKSSRIFAGRYIEEGDFTMRVRMSLAEINKSTALLLFFNNHFGFDSNVDDNGDYNKLFTFSPVTDQVSYFGNSSDYFEAGVPFDFVVKHIKNEMHFSINNKPVAVIPDSLLKQPLAGAIGFRPWRNIIRIYDWTFEGHSSAFPKHDYLFERGEASYSCFRIPAIVQSKKGTLLAFAEGRQNSCLDNGDVDVVLKRSEDGGETWSELQVVWADSFHTCSYAAPIVEDSTGKIIIITVWQHGKDHHTDIYANKSIDTRRIYYQESLDDGHSWSTPREITTDVKKENWTYYGLGYTSLIQLQKGPKAGRLLLSAYHGKDGTDSSYVHLIYSDDLGKSWQLGGICPTSNVSETEIVELPEGQIYLLIRNHNNNERERRVAFSTDGGESISETELIAELDGFVCQTSLLPMVTADSNFVLLQTSPANNYAREKLLLRLSRDEGKSWEVVHEIYRGHAAYSDLIALPDGEIGILYECGNLYETEGIVFKKLGTLSDFKLH